MTGIHPAVTDPDVRAMLTAPQPPPGDTAARLALLRGNPSWVREPDDERVVSRDDRLASGLTVRVYRPRAAWPAGFAGTLVFAHGGGWVAGTLETNDRLARELCAHTGAQIVSVDYRLAPEHPFPAALDDLHAALDAVAAGAFDADPAAVGVAGHSAGGNLAAGLALRARAGTAPAIRCQVLLCPVLDSDLDRPAYAEFAAGLPLTGDDMRWYWSQYAPDAAARLRPEASPLRAPDLAGSAPAAIAIAAADPLRDEALAYGRRLRAAGVPVHEVLRPGVPHLFLTFPPTPARDETLAALAPGIRAALAPQP